MPPKRTPTTKDIALLKQLSEQGQLTLAPEFQRLNVWPKAAKAYLIDTILNDRPIPLFFLQKTVSPQTGKPGFSVVDGQQRLRAIFDFIDGRFRLSQSAPKASYYNKRFAGLPPELQDQIRNYDLTVQELTGYSDEDIKDTFVRINKYVVKLSPQELRHAKAQGAFYDFVERIARWQFWRQHRVISGAQLKRMRAAEFAAELAILIVEGPQDKKSAVDLYYFEYQQRFQKAKKVEAKLLSCLKWIEQALPSLSNTRYRRPTDLYSLIGALDALTEDQVNISLKPKTCGRALLAFETKTKQVPLKDARAIRYATAASRQTDNIQPRTTRIQILADILSQA